MKNIFSKFDFFHVPQVLNVQMNEIKKIELFLRGILSKSKNIELRRKKM